MGYPSAATTTATVTPPPSEVLDRLSRVSGDRGHTGLARRLTELMLSLREDLESFETSFGEMLETGDVVRDSAAHLLARGGKRMRPLCVMLASRVGEGFDDRGVDLAVAAELVHSATLLHDDVVDLGDVRRGAPAARTVFGNAASIFAGDWLLIEALRRVRRAGVPGTLGSLLDVIDEMIRAEALQLESRGRLDVDRDGWLRVVEGKTASLFRWVMLAGANAGGLSPEHAACLEAYGMDIGVAFQAVDDLLDLAGDAGATGKALFADVREGKMTWPLIVALERAPEVAVDLAAIASSPPEASVDSAAAGRVLAAVKRTEALADCRAMAEGRIASAVARLDTLPDTPATRALATVAAAVVERRS
ncbi:MAG: polyprenyl synthetase family protein [Deltaproteobacteria bacterium]|nr:polyprenyl synthetase family protein [Deltaproteobacteria bacterium]